jgi:hypothetical protein
MRRCYLLLALITGCEFECRDYVPEKGRECRYAGQELELARTSPLAPPVAVCRCPVKLIPEPVAVCRCPAPKEKTE